MGGNKNKSETRLVLTRISTGKNFKNKLKKCNFSLSLSLRLLVLVAGLTKVNKLNDAEITAKFLLNTSISERESENSSRLRNVEEKTKI